MPRCHKTVSALIKLLLASGDKSNEPLMSNQLRFFSEAKFTAHWDKLGSVVDSVDQDTSLTALELQSEKQYGLDFTLPYFPLFRK